MRLDRFGLIVIRTAAIAAAAAAHLLALLTGTVGSRGLLLPARALGAIIQDHGRRLGEARPWPGGKAA